MPSLTDGMTLEEQAGQALMAGFFGTAPSPEIIELIRRHHVGSIILFLRNVHDAEQVLELTQRLQSIAKEAGHRYPLLIAIDQENGIVQRLGEAVTIFPGNMALGAIGSSEIAFRVAQATGEELRALGINMNLAPVVDVNNNPDNPVIGVRSFGADAELVARLGAAMVRGYHAAGIISCLKHFPGHGDTATDSHQALPTIPHSLERLDALELVPFGRCIEADAGSVMIAHIAFPALEQNTRLPATLSPRIIQGLLRERLVFGGLVLSDCLEMLAISATYGTERAAVMALQAGIDLALVSHHFERQRGSIEAILSAARTGELAPRVVERAAERVLQLKARYLSCDTLTDPGDTAALSTCIGGEAHLRLQEEAYRRSTILVRNDAALLPLRLGQEDRLVILSPIRNFATMVEDRHYSDDVLAEILRRYHANVSLLPVPPDNDITPVLASTAESDTFIVATVNAHLDDEQAVPVRALVVSGRRIIVIAVRNPYDLRVFPDLRTYLTTFEYTRPALVTAARLIFGEQ